MATNQEAKSELLYKDLSYQLQGLFFAIRNDLGSGHKEAIYQKALEKELERAGIAFMKEPSIKIYSQKGDFLGVYRPDFIVDDKIIIELKAVEHISRQEMARVYDYLRNSQYELAYLVNFAGSELFSRRLIFTNDRKPNSKIMLKSLAILFVAISALFVGIRGAAAAEFYFGAPAKIIGVNALTEIGVFLNTEKESINAVEGSVEFPREFVIDSIRDGNSIVSFWPQKPVLGSGSSIDFQGIMPGGYNGSQGYLFSVIVKSQKEGDQIITLKNASALLNNGSATAARLHLSPLTLHVAGTDAQQFAAPEDTAAPEIFTPSIGRDPEIFDGKAFLVFAAQDKGSGINHYEVREGRWGSFVVAQSPYKLTYQALNRKIFVKAVDAQGNVQVVTLDPEGGEVWYQRFGFFGILLVIAIGVAVVLKTIWSKFIR